MSTLLAHSPRFSSSAALLRHYRAVKQRMRNLAPPPVLALPSPEMIAKGNPMPPALVPAVPVVPPKVYSIGPMATVEDIVPSQYGKDGPKINRLPAHIEYIAIRRAITAYFVRLRHVSIARRTKLVRDSVATAFKVDVDPLVGVSKCAGVARVRQIGMCLGRRLTEASSPDVGRAFGGRDHTTVLYAVNKMAPIVDAVIAEMYDGKSCDLDVEPDFEPESQVLDGQ